MVFIHVSICSPDSTALVAELLLLTNYWLIDSQSNRGFNTKIPMLCDYNELYWEILRTISSYSYIVIAHLKNLWFTANYQHFFTSLARTLWLIVNVQFWRWINDTVSFQGMKTETTVTRVMHGIFPVYQLAENVTAKSQRQIPKIHHYQHKTKVIEASSWHVSTDILPYCCSHSSIYMMYFYFHRTAMWYSNLSVWSLHAGSLVQAGQK